MMTQGRIYTLLDGILYSRFYCKTALHALQVLNCTPPDSTLTDVMSTKIVGGFWQIRGTIPVYWVLFVNITLTVNDAIFKF